MLGHATSDPQGPDPRGRSHVPPIGTIWCRRRRPDGGLDAYFSRSRLWDHPHRHGIADPATDLLCLRQLLPSGEPVAPGALPDALDPELV